MFRLDGIEVRRGGFILTVKENIQTYERKCEEKKQNVKKLFYYMRLDITCWVSLSKSKQIDQIDLEIDIYNCYMTN